MKLKSVRRQVRLDVVMPIGRFTDYLATIDIYDRFSGWITRDTVDLVLDSADDKLDET